MLLEETICAIVENVSNRFFWWPWTIHPASQSVACIYDRTSNDAPHGYRGDLGKSLLKKTVGQSPEQKATRGDRLMRGWLAAVAQPNRKGTAMYADAIGQLLKPLIADTGWTLHTTILTSNRSWLWGSGVNLCCWLKIKFRLLFWTIRRRGHQTMDLRAIVSTPKKRTIEK
ncbi:MAG TPA: hypothetical protein DC054_09345 [Blastocatellia bacterium]|nr:hypothetical protein [Blastocatellia bacterium]